jgi:PAS domain S-box-containing protein
MGQVAGLTVPVLADVCVIDLLDEDGSIRDVAVVADDEQIAHDLEVLRAEHPLDRDGNHPVARVIGSGQPELLPRMTSSQLRSFAQGSAHARFMLEHDYRSAVVVPLLARERTLGALSVLRLGASEPYDTADMDLVFELARRAALAIDNARLFSELRIIDQRLQAILANLAEAITVVDEKGRTVFANQAAADLLGVATPTDLTDAEPGTIMPRFLVSDEHGRELDLDSMPSRRLFRGETVEPLLVRNVVRATGQERWLNVRCSPLLDPETGRVAYAVNVFEDITAVKRAQLTESFMAEASRVLSSSMDYKETLQRVAQLAVPQIADWCAVDVLSEGNEIERVAVYHPDPTRLELARRLDAGYRPTLDEPAGVPEVIRTGQGRIFTDIQQESLASYARDEEHLRLLSAIGATSVIIVPMAGATDSAIGAITLVCSESDRRLSDADLGLAVRLGRRAGTAVERARLFTERSRIAHILERALLPESLPDIPGAEVRALYSAAGELNEVGGDFYDVFEYERDHWLLLVGDVCGKGPRAAGVTALARHTLRAAALSGQSPAQMIGTLHSALRHQPPGADLCTVCLVTLTHAGRMTVTLAGHQPPLLIDTDGQITPVGQPGTLLGVTDSIQVSETETQIKEGQTLLMYTDGVPEASRQGERFGERKLLELCAQTPHLPLRQMLSGIEQAVLEHTGGELSDDMALLALRLGSASVGRPTPASSPLTV